MIGTRGSKLALAQTALVAEALREAHPDLAIELVVISTRGDRVVDVALSKIGDKGVFVSEIEAALSRGEIDLAVHSAKDLPSQLAQGLMIGAIPTRADAADMLVLRAPVTHQPQSALDALPLQARVGSSSLRRASQLRALRSDLSISDVRGNIDTRLRKLAEGQYDALVLAAAGLVRLGWRSAAFELDGMHFVALPFTSNEMLPAVGQGALALECRADDVDTLRLLQAIDDANTHACVMAERAFLRRVEGGCQVPVAAYAVLQAGTLQLQALIASLDGTVVVRGERSGPPALAEVLGARLAEQLLAEGGAAILNAIAQPLMGRRIVVTRPAESASHLINRLQTLGATVIDFPVIAYAPPVDSSAFDAAMMALCDGQYAWLALTSAQAVRMMALWLQLRDCHLPTDGLRIAAVGAATAQACQVQLGLSAALVPEHYDAAHLAASMAISSSERVLLLNADLARATLQQALIETGAEVDRVVTYRTVPSDLSGAPIGEALQRGEIDAITFSSGSTVRNFIEKVGLEVLRESRAKLVCIGPSTAQSLLALGLPQPVVAAEATDEGMVAALIAMRV